MEVSHLKMNDRYLPYVLESLSANVQNIHMVSYDLNVYKYLNFLLEKRPNARTAQKELEKLAPWNEEVQKMFARKMK